MQFSIKGIVIGKRVTVGAAITSLAAGFGFMFPDKAAAFTAFAVPVTLAVQIWIANYISITVKEPPNVG